MSDLIDRRIVIDAITNAADKWDCSDDYLQGIRAGIRMGTLFSVIPSVQPEPQWIPCDKGEPDEGMECWVAVKTTDALYRGNFTKRYGERRDKGFITSGGFMWWNTALAWMPIYEPEPYKAESEDKE